MASESSATSSQEIAGQLRSLLTDPSLESAISMEQRDELTSELAAWEGVNVALSSTDADLLAFIRAARIAVIEAVDTKSISTHISAVTRASRRLRSAPTHSFSLSDQTRASAAAHVEAAQNDRRRSRYCTVLSLFLVLAASGSAYWGVNLLSDNSATLWRVAFPTLMCLGLLAAAFIAYRSTRSNNLHAREQERIARAIVDMDVLLGPLPDNTKHLMRAKMAPVLFPMLLENDDPLRIVQWPEDGNLMTTIVGYVDDDDESSEIVHLEAPGELPSPHGHGV
ncbi:MAG: hypothetical protein ACOYBY_10925 [Dermatophilaceae bacterium]